MKSPIRSELQVKQVRFEDVNEDENTVQDIEQEQQQHPYPGQPFIDGGWSTYTQNDPTSTNPLSSNIFQPQPQHPTTSSSTQKAKTPSQYQQRSQKSTAASQLSTARSNRISTPLFLDRLRTSRRDARDQRGAETFEQIDYMRDRRKREAYFERQAPCFAQFNVDGDGDVDELDVMVEEEGRMDEGCEVGMSPTEERELEELVSGYFDSSGSAVTTSQKGNGVEMDDLDFDFDDDDDEQVFMELLSQEQLGGDSVSRLANTGQDLNLSSRHNGSNTNTDGGEEGDGDTEMS